MKMVQAKVITLTKYECIAKVKGEQEFYSIPSITAEKLKLVKGEILDLCIEHSLINGQEILVLKAA